MSAEVAPPDIDEQPLVPTTGRFIWKEGPNGENGTLEWASNNPNADRDRRRRKGNEGMKRNERGGSSVARNNQKGRGRPNQPKSPKAGIHATETHTTVTLDDIKKIALDKLFEEKVVDEVSDTFDSLYHNKQFDHFLIYLLTYFDCFFEKLHQEHKQNISTYIEPSLSEKQALADSIEKLKAAEKYLGQAYCVLVLGLGLEDEHHMACGMNRVSSTDKDRDMFETVYSFCSYVVWITFKQNPKDKETVRKEVGRMLRSDTFNPAIRAKNFPEEVMFEKVGKHNVKVWKKVTPAEYRRTHTKRPAIKSIINQRSPAIVSILPSPKEEAHWLFKRNRPVSPNSFGKQGHGEDNEDDDNNTTPHFNPRTFKVGILGDSLNHYNHQLCPLGAENEDEENDGEEGEQKQGDNSANTAKPSAERRPSRSQTAVSEAVTEAFTDN
ncbi:protein phosphatase 1 regulatory subunit 36-like [Mya arenaria]|uniref:protein phosphatase 1 regulatory subunit 36-like n=1 Tax=Mya arenaria TaxID=6604 RepID=UPI0022E0B6B1|nr:protein phosphatase 1 regulatory subunit 36-like [Mya arenaria]